MPSKTVPVTTEPQPAPIGSGSGRNSVTDNANESTTLPQQILAIVHHKWRNLEKRKKKLDEYKKIGDNNLKADQREALSHFDEVVHLLDLLGDMKKQFETTFSEYETLQRKQAKADKVAQRKRDAERMRDILEIRLVVNTMTNTTSRAEICRINKFSEQELSLVDKFIESVEPTLVSCAGNKTDAYLNAATECFERVLRKDEKPFFEKQTYSQLRGVLAKFHQTIIDSLSVPVVNEEIHDHSKTSKSYDTREEHADFRNRNQPAAGNKDLSEASQAIQAEPTPVSPQKVNSERQPQIKQKDATVHQQASKLDEIVKTGTFSFLQESQISAASQRGGHAREFVNSNSDQTIGQWNPQRSPMRHEHDNEHSFDERNQTNSAVWSNRNNAQTDGSHHNEQQVGTTGNRNRGERGNRHHGQRRQSGGNRRQFSQVGGADENNEAAAAGWRQDDADFAEWKADDANAGANRDGGWISGQDNRRRGNNSARGGRNNYNRAGGQGSSGQQFGDNRRHFNRGPRPSSNQQPRSNAVGQTFAE